jgi:universal stress protein A
MLLPKTILVPTDFSDTAEVVLDYAVELASRLDAKIHVIHVVDIMGFSGQPGAAVEASVIEEMRRASQVAVGELVDARSARASFAPPRVELGDPRTHIDQEARRIGSDLIVMGTHGRRGVKRLLLGSVAESIVRIAPCPVLLVRGPS